MTPKEQDEHWQWQCAMLAPYGLTPEGLRLRLFGPQPIPIADPVGPKAWPPPKFLDAPA